MLRFIKEVAKNIFKQPKNFLKIAGGLTIDLATTTINIIAPVVIVDSIADKDSSSDNDSSEEETTSSQTTLILAMSFMFAAQSLPRLRNMLINSVRANVQKELTYSMVEATYQNELDQQVSARTGEFSQALAKNYTSIDLGITAFFGEIIPSTLEILSTSAFLTVRFGALGLTPAGFLVLYGLTSFSEERRTQLVRQECLEESFKGYGAVIQAVENYQLAYIFDNVNHELDKINQDLVRSEKKFKEKHHKEDCNSLILSVINGVGFIGSIAIFYFFPPNGELDAQQFALFAYFLTRFNTQLDSLPNSLTNFSTALTDGKMIAKHLEKKPSNKELDHARPLNAYGALRIQFNNVSFAYNDRQILDNISFEASPGQKIAIAGPSGCGKTTLARLLLKFYAPSNGEIRVNNEDIMNWTGESLRKHLAVVSQEASIFPGTIEDNIHYGDLTANQDDVSFVATRSKLLNEDSLNRLNEPVGQQGARLSGGEKQRLAIARALLKGGNAFILDEPTSALDAKTEKEVQSLLDRITDYTTTLLVTHRLSTVINADYILYMEQGKIIEQGNFKELIAHRGKFFNQLQVQCQELGTNVDQIKPETQRKKGDLEMLSFWNRRNNLQLNPMQNDNPFAEPTNEAINSDLKASLLENDDLKRQP